MNIPPKKKGKGSRKKPEILAGPSKRARAIDSGTSVEGARCELAEGDPKKGEDEVRTLLCSLPDIVTRSDRSLRYVFVSPNVEEFFGRSEHEFIGKTLREMGFFDDAVESRIEALSRSVLVTGKPRTFEAGYNSPEGVRYLSIRIIPEFDDNGGVSGVLRVKQDITELRKTERSLHASKRAFRRSRRDLARLSGKVLTAEEDERRRIARELHDEFSQRLAGLAMEAGRLEKSALTPSATAVKIRDFQARIVQLSTDVHSLSRRLHPSILDDLGLVKAVEAECRYVHQTDGLEARFVSRNIPDPIPSDAALSLYRIIQEGLKNVAKHAQTKKAYVSLLGRGDMIRLVIQDEGIGFDPAHAKGTGGLGLASMEERARIIGGKISVTSEPGRGTSITVRIPAKTKTT